ncbi:Gypsy retrotransposon integrase-like protein 1 [Knufia peltigerae]|uniref:Gypsy retrotransposon integrase-like protein 1 n=1 Tax=Knufia peltigerae TaxID=1002370 RepID=A0AA38Y586_9EURO|nr:Gypsy retrotransposon integrase-like protein 1 [Knufia peltigerae]
MPDPEDRFQDAQLTDTEAQSTPSNKRRKRAVRACDECRFRKVKILEDRLRIVRAKLEQIKLGKLSIEDADLDAVLNTRDGGLLASDDHPTEEASPPDEQSKGPKLDSMMSRYGRLESDDPWAAPFYGAPSGAAFLHRLHEFFGNENGSPTRSNNSSPSAISLLFDAPLPTDGSLDIAPPIAPLLPHRPTAVALVSVVLAHAYPIFLFLHEPTFHEMVDRIYTKDPVQYDRDDRAFLPLFLLVMGLGYLFSQSEHQKYGCRQAVSQAMRHYLAARKMVDITTCRDLRSLQILLCYTLFLISTARMASAHAFLSLACSSALRLGLHHRSTHDATITRRDRDTRRKIFWTIIKLDMYLSAVLGLPAMIDLQDVDPAIDLTLNEAIHEATSGLPSREAVLLGGSAKHLEIMRIISKAIKTLYPMPSTTIETPGKSGNISISLRSLEEIEAQFRTWGDSTSELLAKGDDGSPDFIRLKFELEMTSFFGKIVLYRPFLHYLAKSSDGLPTAQKASQRALLCIRIASTAITRSETIQQLGLLPPASWTTIYTIFLSVACLIFLIATRDGPKNPIEAWRKAESGIRLLASTTCHETGSKQCLGILKELVRCLSHNVDFDVSAIEASTRRVCSSNSPMDQFGVRGDVTGMHPPLQNVAAFSHSAAPHRVENQNFGVPGQWQMTESHMRLQGQPMPNNMQRDDYQYDPTLAQTALSFPGMESSAWEANIQDATQATTAAETLGDELVDVPTLQNFSWPQEGITENYFSDILPSIDITQQEQQ